MQWRRRVAGHDGHPVAMGARGAALLPTPRIPVVRLMRACWWLPAWLGIALPAAGQNAASWADLSLYGNLETAGVTATLTGDANRNASVTLEWRRVGEATYRAGHPLLRVDATHLVGSLFDLAPGTAYEIRATLADPDGVGGPALRSASGATRADLLVEPTLRTLFVAPGGNDANDGLSPTSALRSIQRAAQLAQAGDLVRVAPGRYHEAVSVPRSGSAVQPIVFRADGAGVVLDGASPLPAGTTWSALGNGVYRTSLGHATGLVASEQGRLFRYASAAALQALAAGAPGGFWFDASSQQLSVKFADGSAPGAHLLEVADLAAGFTLDGRAFVRVEGFLIRHYGVDEYGKGVYLRYSDDCIVRGNRFVDLGSVGVWVKGGARNRIEDNEFSDSSIVGWPWPVTKGSYAEDSAILFTDAVGRGNVVRRNRSDGHFNGIAPCGDAAPPGGELTTETDVYDNELRHHNDDALEPDGYCANLRIFGNVLADSHMGVSVAPAWPGPVWIVRNSAWNLGNTRTSQVDGYISSFLKVNSGYPEMVGPLLLYHNSIVTAAPATEAMYLLDPGVTSTLRSRNNLYVATRYVWAKVNTIAVDADYDLLHTSDATRFVRWLGSNYPDLAALRAALGIELHGLATPPRLVAPATGDLRLLPDSPARDAGVVLPGINDSYDGAAPDLGAFEWRDLIFADGFDTGGT